MAKETFVEKILRYLGQNSTWKGIFMALTVLGVNISPELSTAIITAGLGLIALIDVIRDGEK